MTATAPTRKRSAEREQFLTDILTTAIEGGVNYWATVSAYRWENLEPADVFAELYESEEEDNNPPIHRVTIETIAHGIQVLTVGKNAGLAFSMSGPEYWKQFLLADRTNGDDGDYDADIADNIVQAGLFDQIVFG